MQLVVVVDGLAADAEGGDHVADDAAQGVLPLKDGRRPPRRGPGSKAAAMPAGPPPTTATFRPEHGGRPGRSLGSSGVEAALGGLQLLGAGCTRSRRRRCALHLSWQRWEQMVPVMKGRGLRRSDDLQGLLILAGVDPPSGRRGCPGGWGSRPRQGAVKQSMRGTFCSELAAGDGLHGLAVVGRRRALASASAAARAAIHAGPRGCRAVSARAPADLAGDR